MTLPELILYGQAFIFGLLIGSFLNVCIYRIPKKLTLWGRSFCPACAQPIPFYRNVPVFAYLLQGGKAACCKARISSQYPWIEFLTGVISLVTLRHVAMSGQSLGYYFVWFCLFVSPLIVLSMIDLQLKILPDVITLPGIVVGLAVNAYSHGDAWLIGLRDGAIGLFIGGGVLLLLAEIVSRLKKVDAMGGGDIKLIAMLGAFLGWQALPFLFLASSVIGLVYAISLIVTGKQDSDRTIPFGPFLALAGILYFLYGPQLMSWYLGAFRH